MCVFIVSISKHVSNKYTVKATIVLFSLMEVTLHVVRSNMHVSVRQTRQKMKITEMQTMVQAITQATTEAARAPVKAMTELKIWKKAVPEEMQQALLVSSQADHI